MGAEASSLEAAEAVLVDGDHNRGRGKVAQRREHSVEFIAAVAAFNAKHCAPPGGGALAAGGGGLAPLGADGRAGPRIRVAVRKRPLFEHERARRDFDVVSCAADGVWLHRCLMRADLKHMACESFDFAFPDGTFAETEDTDAVFRAAVAPLVASAAQDGGVSTVLCFGQTGSGKTHTMGGLADRVAAALFAALDVASRSANRSTAAFYGGMTVGAVCVEVAGSKIRDLLGDDDGDGDGDGSSNNAVVKLLEDEAGIVHLRGATEAPTADGAQLAQALRAAQARRASAATGVHDASSRSHSVCRVTLRDGATGAQFARVDLVDLAGSEWAADREKHDKRRQREGIEINASLMALKACMRNAIAPGTTDEKRLPYRQSALTKLLKTAFVGEGARTLLLATVSPASADTEHTLSTLQHVAAIAASGEAAGAVAAAAAAEAEAGAALQTEATKVARRVLTTNVKQARALLREMEGGGADGAAAAVEGAAAGGPEGSPEAGWEATNPIDWTPTDVCVWWTEAAARGVTLINDAVAAAPPAGGAPPSPTAEESLSLVLEAGGADGPLGLSFVKAAAAAAAAEGAGGCAALPVVGSVKAGSAIAVAHAAHGGGGGGGGGAGAGGLKGWRLLGVAGTAAPRGRAEVLSELKACAKERPLALLFWPPLPPVEPTGPITRSPAVPRIFTGKSRLGEADGDYMCATFNQKRFVDDATDPRLGRLMYAELHQIIQDSGGPFTPGVDGGCAEGGDGGERARRKAEEHAAAEAAKWGR